MASLGSMYANIGLNVQPLQAGLRSAEASIKRFEDVAARRFEDFEKKSNTRFARVQKSLFNLRTAFAAGIGIAVVKDIVQTAVAFEKLDLKMTAALGSSRQAAVEFEFVSSESERLGLRLKSAADMYGTLAAAAKQTSLQGQGVRDIFTAVAEAGTVLQLNGEDVRGALYAISQMISKGKVSMEELRQQLGERIPGALLLAQRAMGMTGLEFEKLITKGNLTAQEFLPKLAKEIRRTYGAAVPAAMKATQSEMNRFMNTWDELKVTIAKGGVLTALRILMKAFIETYKYINFATTVFVANLLKLNEMLGGAWDVMVLGIKKVWNEMVQAMVDSIAWAVRKIATALGKLGGLAGDYFKGIADDLEKYSQSGEIDFGKGVQNIIAQRKQNMSGIDQTVGARYDELYGAAPEIGAPMAAAVEAAPVSPEQSKAVTALANLRKKMQEDLNASIQENANLEDSLHNRKLLQAQTEYQKRVQLLEDLAAKGVQTNEEELINRQNFEAQLQTIALEERKSMHDKLRQARAANLQDEVAKAQTALENLRIEHEERLRLMHALRDEGINVEQQLAEAHALYAEERKKKENDVLMARIGAANSVFNSLSTISNAFNSKQDKQSRKEFERQKKMNIGLALINTALGAVTAFAQTPGAIYVKLAAAAAAVAAGMAQVRNIRKQQYGGGGGGAATATGGGAAAGGADSVNTDVGNQQDSQSNITDAKVVIQVTGDVVDLDQWMEKKGAVAINKAVGRGVDIGITQDAVNANA